MGKNIHVTRRSGGKWAVSVEGDGRASGLYDLQRKAIDAATLLVQRNKSELVIHDRENRIRDRDSFGRDPNPPRDTRH